MPEENEDPVKLFQEAVRDARPLKTRKQHLQQRKTNQGLPKSTLATRRASAEEERPLNAGIALAEGWVEPVEPEQILSFQRPGLQHDRIKRLRLGQLDVDYWLDLHGYKIEEARDLVLEFLNSCHKKKLTCVGTIHGKSHRSQDRQATLKSHVNHWLKQCPTVLAFHSAPQNKGGAGSLLILLKRKR